MLESIRKSRNVNLPNILTVLRLILAFFVPFLILRDTFWVQFWGGVIFTIAAVTDYLDGYLARQYGQITTFGKIVDPIADKLLTLGAFVTLSTLTTVSMYSFWLIVPILIREIGITVLRFYFLYHGTAVAAVKSGKQKTTLQITAISVAYFNFLYQTHLLPRGGSTIETLGIAFDVLMYISLILALLQTVYSGYDFMRLNWDKLFPKKS